MTSTVRRAASGVAAGVVFCASLLLFDAAATTALDRGNRWLVEQGELRHALAALPDKSSYQVLVLGSSRTFEAIHPSAIEGALGVKAYKEAYKGKGLRYSYEFYQMYRELVGKPRVVVYGVDYFMFDNATETALLRRLQPEAPRDRAAGRRWFALQTLAHKKANDRVVVRLLERVQRRFTWAEFDPERNQADMAIYTGPKESRVLPRPEPPRYDRVTYARFPGLEGEYLTRLLEACAADEAAMMFVYPPDYVATGRTNFEHDGFVREFRRLIADTPNAFFFDYHDPARFPTSDPSMFWDGDWGNPNSHLSRRGAEAFARLYTPDLARVLASSVRRQSDASPARVRVNPGYRSGPVVTGSSERRLHSSNEPS